MTPATLTAAICTFNSADHLRHLIPAVGQLRCPIPFEILIVDNNSTDATRQVVEKLRGSVQVRLRYVFEAQQGIAYARNRAIDECWGSTYLAFIDADELPDPSWLEAACNGLHETGADCVGGRIKVDLPARPRWLTDSLLPFLGQVDYGATPLEIIDDSTPVWTGNIAYRTTVFKDGLRFDTRYNRAGAGIGGGEDQVMFHALLESGHRIRYEPLMSIVHLIPPWKLKRTYFLRLHYLSGRKAGTHATDIADGRKILGVPRYMYSQLLHRLNSTLKMIIGRHPERIRAAMTLAHHVGMMKALHQRITKQDRMPEPPPRKELW